MIKIERRDFIKMINTGICTFCISSFLKSCEFIDERLVPEVSKKNKAFDLNITDYEVLNEIGKALTISIKEITGGIKLIIIRLEESGENAFIVMSTICPHYGYFISVPDTPGQNYHCNEHNSEYDYYTGEIKHSPDTEPDFKGHLLKFKTEFDDDTKILRIFY